MANEDEIDDVLPARKKRPDDEAIRTGSGQPRRDNDEPHARGRDDEFEDDPRPRRRRDEEEGDVTGGVIPYKNGRALASYYCGVFSLIPCVGMVLGPIAIILGFLGFSYANKHPKASGKAHAVVGIILGMIVVTGHLTLALLIAGGALSK
jgi:hypothetical protein